MKLLISTWQVLKSHCFHQIRADRTCFALQFDREDFEKTRQSSESDNYDRNCKDSKTEAIAKSTSIITDELAGYGIILLLYYDCCHHTAITATGTLKSWTRAPMERTLRMCTTQGQATSVTTIARNTRLELLSQVLLLILTSLLFMLLHYYHITVTAARLVLLLEALNFYQCKM